MRQVIFINGPAHSGKDEAAKIIMQNFHARHYKMSRPLKAAFGGFFMLHNSIAHKYCEDPTLKDIPGPATLDFTPRQVLISISEDWAKPTFGDDVLGRLALGFILASSSTNLVVISDSGFREEAEPIVERVGPENCLLLRMHRKGCNFDGDSRSYIELADLGVTEVDVQNHFDLYMLQASIKGHLDAWMKL